MNDEKELKDAIRKFRLRGLTHGSTLGPHSAENDQIADWLEELVELRKKTSERNSNIKAGGI